MYTILSNTEIKKKNYYMKSNVWLKKNKTKKQTKNNNNNWVEKFEQEIIQSTFKSHEMAHEIPLRLNKYHKLLFPLTPRTSKLTQLVLNHLNKPDFLFLDYSHRNPPRGCFIPTIFCVQRKMLTCYITYTIRYDFGTELVDLQARGFRNDEFYDVNKQRRF